MRRPIDQLPVAAMLLAALSCGGEMRETQSSAPLPTLAEIPPVDWERLAERRIFFGHQSVGGNLLEGVQEVLKANPQIPLRIVETSDPTQMSAPGLYHALIGVNGAPDTKLAAFSRIVSEGIADSGAAMLKYCYVDITGETDPVALFESYRQTADSLRATHPGLILLHVTLPLQVDPGTLFHWRTVVRGKQTPYRTLNAVRQRYNELMRRAYANREPIFDLAHLESISADGVIVAAPYKGERIPALAGEWSSDGGHLNAVGRRRLAEAFLVALSRMDGPSS